MSQQQRYTPIRKEEFEDHLTTINKKLNNLTADHINIEIHEVTDPTGTKERVYEINIPRKHTSIRILSTIEGSISRPNGEDSIKTLLWHTKANRVISGKRFTKRLPLWESNLEEKVINLFQNYKHHIEKICPDCNGIPVKQEVGPFKEYYYCPDCGFQEDC